MIRRTAYTMTDAQRKAAASFELPKLADDAPQKILRYCELADRVRRYSHQYDLGIKATMALLNTKVTQYYVWRVDRRSLDELTRRSIAMLTRMTKITDNWNLKP